MDRMVLFIHKIDIHGYFLSLSAPSSIINMRENFFVNYTIITIIKEDLWALLPKYGLLKIIFRMYWITASQVTEFNFRRVIFALNVLFPCRP